MSWYIIIIFMCKNELSNIDIQYRLGYTGSFYNGPHEVSYSNKLDR